jgi:hypothetical protein
MEDVQPIVKLNNGNKTDWNNFQDHLSGDHPTPQNLQTYQTLNPDSKLSPEHIPIAINEVAAIKSNPDIPGLTPAYKNGNNLRYPVTSGGKHLDTGGNPSAIPKPNYDDPQSRLNYAAAFTKKYGPLMQGRGDTPLRINETPDSGSDTAKNLAAKAASKYGLDPALLYSSAMEEGMSGLFPDKNGKVDFSGDQKHPISGFLSFGLDRFSDQVPELMKKGYLDNDFANKFVKSPETNDKGEKVNSANFTDTDSALQAKAAVVKNTQDHLQDFAKKNNINLSPKATEFFSLVGYNGGEGNMRKMLNDYQKAGALKDDNFITNRPTSGGDLKEGSYKQLHENVSRRLIMRDSLKSEGLF